ncbi:hypothetical protein ACSAZL_11685 [Methanosarcina sp. T3]|uniref:hypothetical protein n=1 Tax=Methanosarcina sp. T3 TaxID=3439062 RepID=UPI003F82EF31
MLNETETIDAVSKIVVPSMPIFITGIITIFVTYLSLKYNARNIYIMANQAKIGESIEKLAEIARRGQKEEIQNFLDSTKSIYIPNKLKKKIRKEIKRTDQNFIQHHYWEIKSELFKNKKKKELPKLHERILDVINEYISP